MTAPPSAMTERVLITEPRPDTMVATLLELAHQLEASDPESPQSVAIYDVLDRLALSQDQVVEARDHQRATTRALRRLVTCCRACRDEAFIAGLPDPAIPAEFILWGKLFAPELLGPRCYNHAAAALGAGINQVAQYAVVDLRPIRAALAANDALLGSDAPTADKVLLEPGTQGGPEQ